MREIYTNGKKKSVEIVYDAVNNSYHYEGSVNFFHYKDKMFLIKKIKALGYKKAK